MVWRSQMGLKAGYTVPFGLQGPPRSRKDRVRCPYTLPGGSGGKVVSQTWTISSTYLVSDGTTWSHMGYNRALRASRRP